MRLRGGGIEEEDDVEEVAERGGWKRMEEDGGLIRIEEG